MSGTAPAQAPVRRVPMGAADVTIQRRADGAQLLKSPHPLESHPRCLTERLAHWAGVAPDRDFVAKRNAGGTWDRLTYGAAHAQVLSIAQALLARGLSADRPVAILSDSDLQHALIALACMHVGIAYVPVSSAYSLVSTDHAKLRYVMDLLTPGLIYAADERFRKAIEAAVPVGTEVLYGRDFATLAATRPTEYVHASHAAVGPDTIAKFLLTSGSTGQPKAVINTQRMLCSNQQMILQGLPSLAKTPPVLVDWLPWNHTAGANHNFGLVLYNGGTIYIDDGRPVPGLIEKTVQNLREISPTIYFSVPRGYDALLPFLREDKALRDSFFRRLELLQYAAAVLPQPTWKAYEDLAAQACGERVQWITGYGATETTPAAMFTASGARRSGTCGLPVDGLEMKLAPVEGKFEARFRGPSITPGYWRQPELTKAAFDDEGYYRTGDALRWIDESQPSLGLEFDGRLTEDFKLGTGVWISVGPLRARINAACAPLLHDAVITGHSRDDLGALLFLSPAGCKDLAPEEIRARLQSALRKLARESTGSSNRITRALVLTEPPSIDAGEITDKGSINQRAVLSRRAALVERLYSPAPDAEILLAVE